MKDIPKKYNPQKVEEKWYDHWMKKKYFFSNPDDRESYTIVIPPPNVTGVLHMGHMLNNTLQDVMVRKARMEGFNCCWVPGTDHASIATEAKVVDKLMKNGIDKKDLSRQEFLDHAWEWKEKHGGIILEQLKKLGASCDWKRTKFTMDDELSESVIDVFIDLFNKGLIYRGVRMVNWDPEAQTAVSDEEVIHKEVQSKLFYIKYKLKNSTEVIEIATTRPETILGDSAICVNPNDKRYKHLKNKYAIVPLINREIPIIFDDYVDMEFGSGALKITPAHDVNDYKIGIKHDLEIIDILNDDGSLNENAILFTNKDRFEVRKLIEIKLKENNSLSKVENHLNSIGFSERTNSVIEPKLSMQWFCKMKEFSKPALDNVLNDNIKFHPKKFKNTYKHWLENIKDWCVSRQLWWGQQIPAYYYDGNKFVVAKNKEEALILARKKNPNINLNDLKQDEDVLDTWFSSWLWPISVFDGIRNPNNKEINYYYPTNDLVTAPEILFFWVARMIMAGYEYKNDMPFKNVYLTGIVRDKLGRKMSKSLGNSPDPIALIDKYGADGVRVGMLLCSPAGNDLPFNENLCEQGRNFSNKIWNAFRLIKSWKVEEIEQTKSSEMAILWFENKLNKELEEINKSFKTYRISEALMTTYKLIWDDFCSIYLEIIKPAYGLPIDKKSYDHTVDFLEKLLKSLHPFSPFITEEIWHLIKDRNDDIIISDWPKTKTYDENLIQQFSTALEVVSCIRNFRKEKNIQLKQKISLLVKQKVKTKSIFYSVICKLANIDEISVVEKNTSPSYSFMIGSDEYFIPYNDSIDMAEEVKKIEKEIEYIRGFIKIVNNKLSNQNFIKKAPKNLVESEKNKLKDGNIKLEILTNKLKNLK